MREQNTILEPFSISPLTLARASKRSAHHSALELQSDYASERLTPQSDSYSIAIMSRSLFDVLLFQHSDKAIMLPCSL